jgi:prolyl oligopeptidase
MGRLPLSLTLVIAACAAAGRSLPQRAADALPFTRTVAPVGAIHGVRVPDPYRWLEDEKSPEVQAWMAAQDDYARDRLRRIPGRDALAAADLCPNQRRVTQ